MGFNRPDTKKPSPRAHEPAEDDEPVRINPRALERSTHAGYDRSKQ
jgi:hypothetical protein